ncbi:MAG: YjjG family noncanonical pyrimidine nucleotidase [Christensenellales bacterium]
MDKNKLIVLIDADDTILDFKTCERNAISRIAQLLQVEDVKKFCDEYHVVNDAIWKEFEQGLLTVEQIAYMRFDRIFDIYGIKADSKKISEFYKEYLSQEAALLDGAREFLEKCYKQFRLFVITNGITYTQQRRFRLADINKYFEKIYISEQIGARKPQKEFFDYVKADVKNFDSTNAVVVGDSLTSDVAGGIGAGLVTVWFNKKGKAFKGDARPTYTVDNFDDLYRLLSNFGK